MRRILALVVGLTLAVLAACSGDGAKPGEGPRVCVADADCGNGVCDPFRGCVACRASSQCEEAEVCLGGECQLAQPCTSDQACSDGQLCDKAAQTCVDCLKSADCEAGAACVSGACQPASTCQDAQGCRPGTFCDLARATCVECLGAGDCSAGERCVDQTCRQTCATDAACDAGLRCDPLLDLCLECVTSSDCAETRHCSAGRCELDLCVAGAGTCEPVGQAIQLCNSAGDRVVPLYCGKGATCEGEPGQGACTDWICTPGMSRCNAAGVLETCSADGLSVASDDCAAANQVCIDTKCVDIVCEPGASSCDAATNTLHTCSALGTVDSLTPCSVGQYCDAAAGACVAKVCTPHAETCVDDVPSICNELGSGYDPGKACKATQACVDGGCLPLVCDPSDQFCGDDGNVYACNATGTVATQVSVCEHPEETGEAGQAGYDYSQHCEKHGSSAACHADPCSKGQTYCEQNVLKTCNAQGTGPVDAGQNCGADAVCLGYAPAFCVPKICSPSTRFCDADGNSVLCSADGTTTYVYQYCDAGQYCDAADAYCKYETCTPSAPGCNGSVATTCKADGSTWEAAGTDCALSSKVCEDGTCKTKICEPDQYFCKSGNPNLCNATGTAGTVADTCGPDAYCSPGYWYCQADVCTGGQPVCADLTHLATCKADGSGPNGAGTACGANKACDAGQCKAQVCTPDSTFCQGGHVQVCDSYGLASFQSQYCFADEFCKTSTPTSAVCAKKVCTPGTKGCNGETYATCDSLGSGYLDSPTDCAATNKLCSLSGCASSAADELGDSSSLDFTSGNNFAGDVFHVTAARTLTKLEIESGTDLSAYSLHWAVYESATLGGPYAPVLDAITAGGPAGFQSTGAISRQLKAGFYYMVGLQIAGIYWMPYHGNSLGPALSFGEPLGGWTYYVAEGTLPPLMSNVTPSASILFHIRLTTSK